MPIYLEWPQRWTRHTHNPYLPPPKGERSMLELMKRLMDLKGLVGADYYGDLREIALAALSQDWEKVIGLEFDLAKKVTLDQLFPTVRGQASAVTESDLDAVLTQLGDSTAEVTTAAADPNAKITPGEIITIITLVADLIKMWRERRGN